MDYDKSSCARDAVGNKANNATLSGEQGQDPGSRSTMELSSDPKCKLCRGWRMIVRNYNSKAPWAYLSIMRQREGYGLGCMSCKSTVKP